MKKYFVLLLLSLLLFSGRVSAQSEEVQQLLLNVIKLEQLKKILNNMYDGYKVLTKGYNTIKTISEGNFSIHKVFLDGLLQV
ncbi:MAG: TerB family tellurite resistance protein, partial [Bacteroidia bacterium]|nr:TerB family tellurite resistance protein [Bacteroidia bacterium]